MTLTIRRFLDALVHPSVRHDTLTSARHRAFIGPRLLGSFALLACFPLYVVLRGEPGAIEVFCFAWLVAPIAVSYFLSRTGRFKLAHALSATSLAVLITVVSLHSGGIASFAAVWLVAVAIEGVLSTSRRGIIFSIALALVCAAFLALVGYAGLLPDSFVSPETQSFFESVGIASLLGYSAALAFLVQRLGHTSRGLLNAEESRYRLLARNMSDVISRHRRNGAIEFISPAAASVFGAPVGELSGHGLFDRVHVAE
ncbi:MAG: PAS domain-containing sensor histidine kinase, partial [Hyphomicrobiales bacterium]